MKFRIRIASYAIISVAGLLFASLAQAKVILPSIFSDNMVLQQKTSAAIWGTASANKMVAVIASWDNKRYTTTASNNGEWKIKVATPAYGGPYSISINDGDATVLNNVLIGEVWVCSGQSNMEMPLAGWGKILNYEQEIAAANYPNIRLLQVEKATSNKPLTNATVANNGWTVCNPQYVAGFSSVAYFFAREIYQKTKIPIGLIHTSWGGTIAEAWTSGRTLKTLADFAEATNEIEKAGESESPEVFAQKLADWVKMVDSKDAGYSNGNPVWAASPADNSWQTMAIPTLWENASLPGLDGIVWLTKKVMVPAAMAGKDLQLSLGVIDDDDITWFNGEQIGATVGYTKPRNYTIPARLVKAGENTIAIRIFDGAGGGGLYDDAKMLYLANGNEKLSLSGDWLYKVGADLSKLPSRPADKNGPNRPTVLYNAMLNPFLQYSIKGAIWYQGESNADRADQYATLFPAMIKDWRTSFNQGDFPFYFVQLANYMKPTAQPVESAWAELREAQSKTLSLPNTGMAVTIDIGEADDIHPKNKQEVGRRLALIALAKNYAQKNVYTGPVYKSFKAEANTIRINFESSAAALKAQNGDTLSGFQVAGDDKVFYWANASIQGNEVVVTSPQVARPVAVRYNWANNPKGNLYNTAGLPASPFRTDNWPRITVGNK